MPRKINYSVTRVPSNDWDNIMETITLDGSYSEDIKDEVWTAIENMEDFSNPWIVLTIRGNKATARIFNSEEAALRHLTNAKKILPNAQLMCIKGEYISKKSFI